MKTNSYQDWLYGWTSNPIEKQVTLENYIPKNSVYEMWKQLRITQ